MSRIPILINYDIGYHFFSIFGFGFIINLGYRFKFFRVVVYGFMDKWWFIFWGYGVKKKLEAEFDLCIILMREDCEEF